MTRKNLTEGYNITLNGINAEVYDTPDGVLISNNDFSKPDLDFDELELSLKEFKKRLIKNGGDFQI